MYAVDDGEQTEDVADASERDDQDVRDALGIDGTALGAAGEAADEADQMEEKGFQMRVDGATAPLASGRDRGRPRKLPPSTPTCEDASL